MKVKIVYYPPFDSLVGLRSEEVGVVGSSITVLELLRKLAADHPQVKPYVVTDSDEELRAQICVVAGSNLLRTVDKLEEGKVSEVKILPPISGGS